MKNILVPTDFSENCNKASKLAIEVAALFNAEIHFLHQIKTPVDWVKLSKKNEERFPDTLNEIANAKNELKKLERSATKKDLQCRTFLEYTSDDDNIIKHSKHYHHDFVITGSKGVEKGLFKELFGSDAQKIIRKSVVPVVVVKEDEVSFPFKNIAFVSDFLEDVDDPFKEVLSLANKCNAHIHLLNINTKTDSNSIQTGLQPIKEFVKKIPKLKNYSMNVYNESTVLNGIKKFNEEIAIDLISMCTHSRKGFLSIFSKSIAESVTNDSKLPVMTMHL